MRCDALWTNARLATLAAARPGLGVVEDGLIAAQGGVILYAGARREAPRLEPTRRIDCEGRWITPGLIDPHTHLVYGGDRALEFERRLAGASYAEIARTGGGILSTMRATRAAGPEGLLKEALPRLDALLAEGVTTVEIKSGYGLSLEGERASLRVIRALPEHRRVRVRATFLGAHALPPEYEGDPDGYIRHVTDDLLPTLAAEGLVDAVDAFCETIAFTPAQTRKVFQAAKALGLPVKLHAEQLSNQKGALLAAEFAALSADHLEHLDPEGVAALARAGVTAVLLPGAFYFTRETKPPPIAALRAAGVKLALASDCNPGTSPLTSPLLTMNLAATLFRLTVEECLAGSTREAAGALGLSAEIGALEAGKRCDLAVWSVERPAELVYRMGFNPLWARVFGGAS